MSVIVRSLRTVESGGFLQFQMLVENVETGNKRWRNVPALAKEEADIRNRVDGIESDEIEERPELPEPPKLDYPESD